ncbi:MAG: energy transducer TonB [Burkholderiales bacterium]
MTYDDAIDTTPREKRIARWLAGGIHVAFVLLLILGVSWQQRRVSEPAVAELWGNLSPPKPEPAPPPPKVERKPEPKPEPKLEPKPKPVPKPEAKPVPKPDIALKEKVEKERKLKEQRELEKKKEEEKRKKAQELKAQELEARKKEEEKKRLEKERIAREMDEKRLAQEKQAIADRLAKEQVAAQRALNDKYISLIQNHVRRHIVEPPNLQGNPQVEFDVVLIPGGEVLSVRLRRTSGVAAYDSAVERAILKASPLPLPPDPALFQQFRDLHLKIRPRE